jgi:hypothetical protein
VPTFSEEQLLSFYEDLLAIPSQDDIKQATAADEVGLVEADQSIVTAVERRLDASKCPPDDNLSIPITTSLLRRRTQTYVDVHPSRQTLETSDSSTSRYEMRSNAPHLRVVTHLQELIDQLDSSRKTLFPSNNETALQGGLLSIGLLSHREWEALIRFCVRDFSLSVLLAELSFQIRERHGEAAELSLDLMRVRLNLPEAGPECFILYSAPESSLQKSCLIMSLHFMQELETFKTLSA